MRETFKETGYVRHLASKNLSIAMDSCRKEAWERRPLGKATENSDSNAVAVNRACIISSPSSAVGVRGGKMLDALVEDPELKDLISSLADRPLIPVIKGYKFYREGDFLGIHTDLPQCDITITFSLSEALGPVFYYPQGFKRTRQELEALFADGPLVPESEHLMPLEMYAINIFSGKDLPHARPPHTGPESGIATVCYYAH